MKKILFILIALVCAVTACTKEQMISDLPEDINKPEGGTTGATKAKRGVCQSTNTLDFGQKLVDLKANWYYTWGLDPSNTVEGAEFVPMFWGASSVTKDNCDKINKLYELLLTRLNVIKECWEVSVASADPKKDAKAILAPLSKRSRT